ncbi:MAG TPA: serine/threonine-protein kinase [Candidatus Xenobia bacterium]|jgi:serine/threonine-protein kinase
MRLPRLADGDCVGAYRLQSRLGHGATGRVYQAVHRESGDVVALKIIGFPDDLSDNPERQGEIWERFEREVAVCRRLAHPRVIRLLDNGVHSVGAENFPWLSMPLIVGARSISQVYRAHPDQNWLLDRTEEILDTLVYVHAQDVIHRDLKPDNILIGADGRLSIVDFGLVRALLPERDRLTRTGQAMGTVQYMALEQMGDAKNVDPRADLYSVGMVLFELLEEVTRWADVLPDIMCASGIRFTRPVEPTLARFVTRLAEPNREQRYPTAADALSSLRLIR